MVLHIFIGLLLMSGVSLLVTQGRRKRIWSVMILCGLAIMSYFFVINLDANTQGSFIYQWLPYDIIKADFSISASQNIHHMLKPLILILAGLVYLNTISKGEQHSLHSNTLLILNFTALILLLSSHDFLQLMFAGCMFSIIGFYMPDQILPKKSIFIFNFLAEIAIFMALAIVYGSTDSISLADLPKFADKGHHKDMVSTLLLFAIGCKTGLLFVNGHYFGLNQVSFNRIVATMLMSMSMSALAILIKVMPLLHATPLASKVLPVWIYLSLLVFIIISVFNNDIKSKIIALSLSGMSFALHFVYNDVTMLYKLTPYIVCILLLVSVSFIIIYNSASKETDISCLGGFWRLTKINLFICFVLFFTSIAIFCRIPLNLYEKLFVGLFIISVSSVYRRVFFSKPCNNETIISNVANANLFYIIPSVCICGWFLWQTEFWRYQDFYIFSAVAFLSLVFIPSSMIDKIAKQKIWYSNFLNRFYEAIFIRPLKLCGRILWLAFDVVVIERSIIASISQLSKTVIIGMHKIQENSKYSYLYGILFGIIIMSIYFFAEVFNK